MAGQNSLEVDLQREGQRLLRQIIRAYYPIEFSVLIAGFYRCLTRAQSSPEFQTQPGVAEGVTSKELAAELKLSDKQVQTMLGRLTKEMLIHQTVEEVRDPNAQSNTSHGSNQSYQSSRSGFTSHSTRAITITKYTVRYEYIVNIVRFKHYEILKSLEKQDEGDHYFCETIGCHKKTLSISLSEAFLLCRTYSATRGASFDVSTLFCTECLNPLTLNRKNFDRIAAKRNFNTQISQITKQTDIVFNLLRDIADIRKSGNAGVLQGHLSHHSEKVAPGGKGGLSSAQDLANRSEIKKQRIAWDAISSESLKLDESEEVEKLAVLRQREEQDAKLRGVHESMRFVEKQAEESRELERLKNLEASLFSVDENGRPIDLVHAPGPGSLSSVKSEAVSTVLDTIKQEIGESGISHDIKTEDFLQHIKPEVAIDLISGVSTDPSGFDFSSYQGVSESGDVSGSAIDADEFDLLSDDHNQLLPSSTLTGGDALQVFVGGVPYLVSDVTTEMLDLMSDAEYEHYRVIAQSIEAIPTDD